MEGASDAGSKVKDERSDDDDITVVEDEDGEKETGHLNKGASTKNKESVDPEGGFEYTMQGVLDDEMSPLESRQDSHSTNVDSDASGFHATIDQGLDQGGWSWNKDSEIIQPDMSNTFKDIYFQCEFCHKKLSCKSNLGRHIKEQHSTVKRAYSCLQCLAEFRRKCDLRMHYAKRHPDEIYEVESITYQVSRFAGLEMNCGSGTSYLEDQQTPPDLQQEVFEVGRHAPKDSHTSIPIRTLDINPFDRQASTHITGQGSITTQNLRRRTAAPNSETDFLYQGNQDSMETEVMQRTLDPAVVGRGIAESLHGGHSSASHRDCDYSSCMSLMKQMANKASNISGSSVIDGTLQRQLRGRILESNPRKSSSPPGKRHCSDTVRSGVQQETDVHIVNIIGSADVEDGKNRKGRRNNTDRETPLQSAEIRKESELWHDTSKSSELFDSAGSSNKNELGKRDTSLRAEDVDEASSKITSHLKSGSVCEESMSSQNQNRKLTVEQHNDSHARKIQKRGKRTNRSPYQVVFDEQHSELSASTFLKLRSLNSKKRKLYVKCKKFVAAYEKKMREASVERCTLNKKPTAIKTLPNPLSAERTCAAVCGSPASDLSCTNRHQAASQECKTTPTRRGAREVTGQDIAHYTNSRETCGTQTDLTLGNDQRKRKDRRKCETNPQSTVERDAGNSSESASSSNTSLPVLLDYFGPRLTEYEERSTIEDFGAGGMVVHREITERKYKMEPGEGRPIVKNEIE